MPRPAPAYFCMNSSVFGTHNRHSRAEHKGWLPSIKAGAHDLLLLPQTELQVIALVFLLPLLYLLLFLLQVHKKKKKIIPAFFPFPLHLCFLSISLQESICSGTTTPQEPLCGAVSPTRTILWRVITYKDDFCERQPSPIWSTYFSDD